MIDANESDKPDPVICKFCGEEIAEGNTFIEIKKNLGVKEYTRRYSEVREQYWGTETDYVHLKHILFTQEEANNVDSSSN